MGKGKRRFGRVRQLPSKRWQARYPGPDGTDHAAPYTFATKREAEQWLVLKEAEIQRGDWLSPTAGKTLFSVHASEWLDVRVLKPRTEGLYQGLLKNHILPTFGNAELAKISETDVRRWRKRRLEAVGQSTVAKAYQLLKSILNTAVEDGRIGRNPCRIKGAGVAKTPERRMISMSKVPEILAVTPERFRALVLLAVFAGLRWGELAGLRRKHLDLQEGTVTVEVTIYELDGGKLVEGTPKSDAGMRTVALPVEILPDLRTHLDTYGEPGPEGRVFVGPKGGPLRRSGFRRVWNKVRADVGVPGLHFHDLRHLGNSIAAKNASLKELMARMGHSSTRAALIYQHRSQERDREIAADLGKAFKLARRGTKKKPSGTQRARKRKKAR